MTTRWHGFQELLHDAVHHGATAIERAHRRIARRPVAVVAAVPPLAASALLVGATQAVVLTIVYGSIRTVNATARVGLRLVLDGVHRASREDEDGPGEPG